MEEKDFKRFIVPIIILVFAVLAFFVIKPIVTPVILGLIFAYILNPLYLKLKSKLKLKYLSASIIIVATLIIVIIPIIVLIPIIARQVFDVYTSVIDFDPYPLINRFAPTLMQNPTLAAELGAAISNIKSTISNGVLSFLKSTLVNLPSILFGILILLFTFFFSLLESEKFRDYFSIVFPFPKEYQNKFYEKFNQITNSVLYGQFIVGIAQGLIAGIGYFVLGIPKALLLTIVTMIVGIIPVIGPWLVWIPVDIYLFVQGNTALAIGLLIYGLFVINWVDILLRPQIVASKAEMNSAIALIGTIGGIYAFGVIGILLGPLILAYLILLIEIYRDKEAESIIIRQEEANALNLLK